ncbi:MAG: AbrB/MazE/SpoVT family DNA-binding domain-containing protein [Desulfobacterales bacterium]|jgi:antitoxin component of MazEF toxin-antitoxin module|nr:AbrB/MazE/SpoVT family DNA-binding domain-containing protein [Desulfobacteraceae bacterium]MBT4364761.1 AbrB/MazE/SpoVT family DNA-binding domain-containing protein [Desulfobacteraceae bacterium]MBT7084629.1 AbrB/MazE/SpoVT family DNA-binding domain-containing protein [Desulfobacterales bacterium]MBT7697399.1 AbrB/MazE/SpoVT family DNA-binding domain-containing protein [Desulfobacterales bacterium]
MQNKIKKWRKSLALRIPKSFASKSKLKQDGLVDFSIDKERIVIALID